MYLLFQEIALQEVGQLGILVFRCNLVHLQDGLKFRKNDSFQFVLTVPICVILILSALDGPTISKPFSILLNF